MQPLAITFLGTASAAPSSTRNHSSLVLRTASGDLYMFDCGEATQHQLGKTSLKRSRITRIFITHMHGSPLVLAVSEFRRPYVRAGAAASGDVEWTWWIDE